VTFSRHNLISRVRDSGDFFIMNFLSKQADMIPADMAERFLAGRHPREDAAERAENGYLVDAAEATARFRKAYLDFVEERDRSEKQLFYAASYACNFACSYCYQEGYPDHDFAYRPEVLDAFLAYVDSEFAGDRKYVTIFGGEPLLSGEGPRKTLEHLIGGLAERKVSYAVVTNGYMLESYVELLGRGKLREVQVTLDGVGKAHDERRPVRGGGASFDRIVAGIDAALAAGFTVNLRMVLDKENIAELPALAAFAIERGWTANARFKTQLGRNYELHYCQADQARLFDRLGMGQALYDLAREHPEILEFHRPLRQRRDACAALRLLPRRQVGVGLRLHGRDLSLHRDRGQTRRGARNLLSLRLEARGAHRGVGGSRRNLDRRMRLLPPAPRLRRRLRLGGQELRR
jgi:uncharacterized protein